MVDGVGVRDTLLLDTHIVLWYTARRAVEMSAQCVVDIDRALTSGAVVVSSVSLRELALLDARGRITLGMDCDAWVVRVAEAGIRFVPLEPPVAVASARLPGTLHRDPVDQMLIATARHYGWRLVTRDRRILDYARQGHVRALDAGIGRTVGEPRRRMRKR